MRRFEFSVRAAVRTLVRWMAGGAVALSIGAPGAFAQTRRLVIHVSIADSAGVPVAGADLTLLRGTTPLATGQSDERGRRTLTIDAPISDYEIVGRKIGFDRASRFFHPSADTVAVSLMLARTAQRLDAVRITADEELRRKSYHVDADDIANSSRPLDDAMDVVTKLRPDMMSSRLGPHASMSYDPCFIRDVWVNGQRIVDAPVNEMALAKRPGARSQPRSRPSIQGPSIAQSAATTHVPPPDPLRTQIPLNVWYVLASIKPEHIAEMNYADCFDQTVDRPHARNALFIVLKPGVQFLPGIGSFVPPDRAVASDNGISALPSYRQRVLGVFDESTAEPIPGVEVVDVATGTKALTTATGTVTLAFLPDGTSAIRLHKPGYRDVTMDVTLSPGLLTPITMTMTPQ